jgi:hypothetical protein
MSFNPENSSVGANTFLSSILTLWPLLLIGVVSVCPWLIWRWRRTHQVRRASSFRGNCGDCGYQPATGTQVCPECGGGVLDTRLFRPLDLDAGQPQRTEV